MAFYTFRQNNSGGVFDGPEYVIIEADSADEANMTAMLHHDIYFDGIHKGMDCPCCGDRWTNVCEYDATDKPEIYGKDPAEHTNYLGQPADVKIVRKTVDK